MNSLANSTIDNPSSKRCNYIKTFIGVYMAYFSNHIIREAYIVLKEDIHKTSKISPEALGLIDLSFFLFYSIGLLILGFFADFISKKFLIIFGQAVNSLTFLFIAGSSLYSIQNISLYLFTFAIAGFAQAAIPPASVSIITNWTSSSKRGIALGIWTSASAIGDIIGILIVSVSSYNLHLKWPITLTYVGCVCVISTIISIYFIKENPRTETRTNFFIERSIDFSNIKNIFKKSSLHFLSFTSFFLRISHMSLLVWLPYFFRDQLSFSIQGTALVSCLYSFSILVGSVLIGYLSDKLYLNLLISAAVTLGFFCSIARIYITNISAIVFMMILMGLFCGGSINIIQSAGAASIVEKELHQTKTSLVVGYIEFISNLGGAFAQIIVGEVQNFGWENIFVIISISCFVSVILIWSYTILSSNKSIKKPNTEQNKMVP